MYVTLTTLAPGRFSENVFLLEGKSIVVYFMAWLDGEDGRLDGESVLSVLKSSLRVEHLKDNL